MAKQIEYPADTVDASGKVWPTVGENIRHGNNVDTTALYNKFMKQMVLDMFPMNSILVGEVPPLFSKYVTFAPPPENAVGTSVSQGLTVRSGSPLINYASTSFSIDTFKKFFPDEVVKPPRSLRFWTRVL